MRQSRAALAIALALGLAAGSASCAAAQSPAAAQPAPAGQTLMLEAPDGRQIEVRLWEAEDERAVVVFSHGFNSAPERYALLADWAARGFTVAAPLHVDSLRHPDHAAFGPEQAFATRVADLAVTRGFLQATRPGQPLVAAGHSFGSLMSLISAGALTAAGPMSAPDVRAVVALSSAGDVPGLVTASTWSAIQRPVLMVTGDEDLVPGWVSDWRVHRRPFDLAPAGENMLIVVGGGDHSLVGNAAPEERDLIVGVTADFMSAHALGDDAARARLASVTAPENVLIERR